MKFIKRIVFVLILLVIAFFIYRLISPKSAQWLLFDLKHFSNTTIGTHFSLSGESLVVTWTVLNLTGIVIENTWVLQEITGNDELLVSDILFSEEDMFAETTVTWTIDSWIFSSWTIPVNQLPPSSSLTTSSVVPLSTPTISKTILSKPAPKSSSSTSSDFDIFLRNFGN